MTVLVEDALAADQAAVDAEFVALVLAEQPWGEPRASRRASPPPRGTHSPRGSPPARGAAGGDRLPIRAARGSRRRPDPRVRSPPPRAEVDRRAEEVMTERNADT